MAHSISVDGLFLTRRFRGCGINRYLVNLLRHMGQLIAESGGPQVHVLVPTRRDGTGDGLDQENGFEFVACPALRLRRLWRLGALLPFTGLAKTDTLLLPSPTPLHFKPCLIAVTVHDIIPLLFPDQFRSVRGRAFRHGCISTLRQADLILADSERTKADLVSGYGTPQQRIAVAHLGFDSDLFNSLPADSAKIAGVLNRHGIHQPYFLHVGTLEPRKNLLRLVRAYCLLRSRHRSSAFQLVLCGRPGPDFQRLQELADASGVREGVVFTGPVSDQELAILYRSSQGFVMPSLYEGFGLPLLEAMASGAPVASSDRSCLPEIAGDAATYFNPESLEEIAAAMDRLLTDSILRENLIKRGLARASLFSWQDCARKTLAALRQLGERS